MIDRILIVEDSSAMRAFVRAALEEAGVVREVVEASSGLTAWSSSDTRNGANARARLFGFGGDSLTLAARRLIRQQLRQLTR